MAIWQFNIEFIPRKWAEENNYNASLLYSEEGYDTEIAWLNNQPINDFQSILSNIFPPSKSWHENLLCWGNEKEHDIQVWFENNEIDSFQFRMDLNQKLNSLISKVINTAKELDCVFFYPEHEIITIANEFELKKALNNSGAAKFINDPQGYLSSLPKST